MKLLDEAEALDPLLPVWCIEERGICFYALGRYRGGASGLGKAGLQTFRSRLYRAASLMALGRPEDAATLVREAIASKPNLTAASFMMKERYRDRAARQLLRRRLRDAGLPA